MDPVDEAFARKDKRQAIVVIIIFALIGANGYLIENNILKEVINVILFNIGVLMILFLVWIQRLVRLYEINLRVPEINKGVALKAAVEGRKIDARCS